MIHPPFFHLYGFILGLAICSTVMLVEYKAKQEHFPESIFWRLVIWEFIGGIIGARLYHVVTDFYLYQNKT